MKTGLLSKFKKASKGFIIFMSILGFTFGSFSKVYAEEQKADNAIVGVGAHFSWIVFQELKKELEEVIGRQLNIHGEGSLLGVGCNVGVQNASKSTPENERFGFVCCPLSKEETAKKKIKEFPIATEPVLIIVNKENKVQDLTIEQVRGIFSGKITNWKEVGGEDQAIVVITRLHCKGRPGHWKTILPSASDFTEKRINVKAATDVEKKVASISSAIGHIGSTLAFEYMDQLRVISVDGVQASGKTLKNKTYPFYRQLSVVTNLNPSEDILKMINYVRTSQSFLKIAKQYRLLPFNKELQSEFE